MMDIERKIIKLDNEFRKNAYYFVIACELTAEGKYFMEEVRLRKGDYALFRNGKRKFEDANPEQIEIINDEDAKLMNKIYNMQKLRL